MRRLHRTGWLAAAISIAAAAVPATVSAEQSACQKGATSPGTTSPSDAGGVNIHLTRDGSVWWCPASVIIAQKDIPDGTNDPYQATPESPNANPVSDAISVRKLLSLASINPDAVGFTYIVRDNGTWSTLDSAELSDQPPFQDGMKPIVWINGSSTDYLRPLRSSADTNGTDFITKENGTPLDLYVSTGPALHVNATATPTRIAKGKPVAFGASVTDATAADGTLAYAWSFQDGATATGRLTRHRFAATGTYYVVVSVKGAGNDSGGVSPPLAVTVGSPPKGGHGGTPAGANHNHHAPGSGPAHSNGTQPGGTPSHHSKAGSAKQPESQTGGGAPTGDTTTPSTTTRSPSSTTPAPTSTTPATVPTTPSTTTPRPGRPAAARPHAPKPIELPVTAGTVVRGRLISEVTPVAATQLAALVNPTSQATAPSARLAGGSVTPVAGLAGGGVIVLLLGSGAGAELRSRRRPVSPAPRG